MKVFILGLLFTVSVFSQGYYYAAATAGGGGSHITDSLKLYWNPDSTTLDAGSQITVWYDDIRSCKVAPFGDDTSTTPRQTGTNILYDGNDYLRFTTAGGNPALPTFTGSMTIYAIVDLKDTTSTALLFGIGGSNELTVSIAGNRICALGWDGSTARWANAYSTPFLGKHVIAATFDDASTPKIYLDGELKADVGNTEGSTIADTRVFMGGDGINDSPNNTSIPIFMMYNVEHNSTQVNTNTDSDTFQDLIP